MPVAMMVGNPDGSQEIYDRVLEELDLEGKPAGGILHFAGPSPSGGWRVIEVWESEEAAQRFAQESLYPAFEKVGAPGPPPQREFWPVHNHMT